MTPDEAAELLIHEGYARADVIAVVDSWIDASVPDAPIHDEALGVMRDQLAG